MDKSTLNRARQESVEYRAGKRVQIRVQIGVCRVEHGQECAEYSMGKRAQSIARVGVHRV
ncbi:hypothetical protein AMTR_s00006p00117750 [Amborella trichopoda]|uniref:Uncharacterized protein n=1 Tax=Amborella trichopoda TaxID=13333 RepID=W1PF01_AMBTC|nr:hypothetical protein AMTR_s00006p00117750 [Amborella trichopoda]